MIFHHSFPAPSENFNSEDTIFFLSSLSTDANACLVKIELDSNRRRELFFLF